MQIWAEHFAVFLFLLDLKLCPFIMTTAAEKVGASRASSFCGQHAASLCPLIPYTSKMTTRSLPYKLVDCTSRILWFLKQTFYCYLRFSKRTWNKICFFFQKNFPQEMESEKFFLHCIWYFLIVKMSLAHWRYDNKKCFDKTDYPVQNHCCRPCLASFELKINCPINNTSPHCHFTKLQDRKTDYQEVVLKPEGQGLL